MRFLGLLAWVACKSGVVQEFPLVDEDTPVTPTLTVPSFPDPDPDEPPTPPPSGCQSLVAEAEGAFLRRGEPVSASVAPCATRNHAFAGAAGSTVGLTWDGPPAQLTVLDFLGTPLHTESLQSGEVLSWTLEWTGEQWLEVRLEDDPGGAYTVEADCLSACERPYTRYPLFFMHGMAGTESFLGTLDYWYGVRDLLEPQGYRVYTPSVDPFQSSIVRANQWNAHLDDALATGQMRRFNLIAHSQGGVDARFVAGVLDTDGRVASVTTIATPHRGNVAGDILAGVLTDVAITGIVVDAMFDGLGELYGNANDQDIVAQLESLSVAAMDDFNATVPDRSDIPYFSYSGKTCQLLDLLCQSNHDGEIVTPVFAATHLALQIFEGDNDGLVSEDSAIWGEYLGLLSADHLDEVGLLPGTTAPGFDHLVFYDQEAQRLHHRGL